MDNYVKCKDCVIYLYSGLQPPNCSDDVIGCNKGVKEINP